MPTPFRLATGAALMRRLGFTASGAECTGDGTCLMRCVCDCADDDESCMHCEHYDGSGWCPSVDGCVGYECINYAYCSVTDSQCGLESRGGICVHCEDQLGPSRLSTSRIEECFVCREQTRMLLLQCNHVVCVECWYIMTEATDDDNDNDKRCPVCRTPNEWQPTTRLQDAVEY